jgi:hypothetical protein
MQNEGHDDYKVWCQVEKTIQEVQYEPIKLVIGQSMNYDKSTDDPVRMREKMREDQMQELRDWQQKIEENK